MSWAAGEGAEGERKHLPHEDGGVGQGVDSRQAGEERQGWFYSPGDAPTPMSKDGHGAGCREGRRRDGPRGGSPKYPGGGGAVMRKQQSYMRFERRIQRT